MKLKFTHKTWYFFLLCAAAASMLNGFAVLGGMDFSFLEMVAFCITGITILFLAAEKGSDPKDKRSYFLIFVLLMLSYVLNGWGTRRAGPFSASCSWWVPLRRSTCSLSCSRSTAAWQACASGPTCSGCCWPAPGAGRH